MPISQGEVDDRPLQQIWNGVREKAHQTTDYMTADRAYALIRLLEPLVDSSFHFETAIIEHAVNLIWESASDPDQYSAKQYQATTQVAVFLRMFS